MWRWGIGRLKAQHPCASLWPSDPEGWKRLLKDWKLACEGMKPDEFQQAVEHYGRSSQSKYVPTPGALWTVLREIPDIQEEDAEPQRTAARRRKAVAWRKSVKEAELEKSSPEIASKAMAEIKEILRKARSHRPQPKEEATGVAS